MLPYVYRITKYDPADRDEHGSYVGAAEAISDHGPVEDAYLQAVAAFVADAGIDQLAIREPQVPGFVHFGLEPAVSGHGLTGIFPPDLTGYHDGATVPVAIGLELVRAMLRDDGAWCRLEVEGAIAIHVGWDQYVYVGTSTPPDRAVARTQALGLFPERMDASPYDASFDEREGEQRPADEDFWAQLRLSVARGEAAILEECSISNASRWHRLTSDTVGAVRARLTPRAQLTVWPDLSPGVDTVLAGLPDEGLVEFVGRTRAGGSPAPSPKRPGSPNWPTTSMVPVPRPPCPSKPISATRCSPQSCPTATVCCGPDGGRSRRRATGTGPS